MINLKGGTRKRFDDHIGITPLYNMLKSRNATLELIADDSLFSFIFRLTVTEDSSEYLNADILNSSLCRPISTAPVVAFNAAEKDELMNATVSMDMDGNFNTDTDEIMTPITNYILKIVVLSRTIYRYGYSKHGEKSTDTPDKFFEEANLQEDIWKYSIRGGRLPLCPPVANIWNFDNKNSTKFIKYLINTFGGWRSKLSSEGKNSLVFIQQLMCSNEHLNIGVSLMPEIRNSYTLKMFDKIYKNNQDAVTIVALKSMALLMRLFIETGIIQKDFHENNILVYPCGDSVEVILIDFGVIENVRQMNLYGVDQPYVDLYRKYWEQCRLQYETLTDTRDNRMVRTRASARPIDINLLNTMLKDFYLNIIEQRVSLNQQQWIAHYFNPNTYMQIFEYLKSYSSANIQAGNIVDTSLLVERPTYSMEYVEFPSTENGDSGCAVMGGRKSRLYKSNKKTKRRNNKKQFKNNIRK